MHIRSKIDTRSTELFRDRPSYNLEINISIFHFNICFDFKSGWLYQIYCTKTSSFQKNPTLLQKLYYYNINISLFRARITQYTTYIVYINLDEHSIELYLVDCVPSVHFSRLDSSGYIFLISFRTLVTIKADLLFCAVGQLIG